MEAGRRKNREREIGKKKEGETANLKEKYGNTAEEKMFKGFFFFQITYTLFTNLSSL